MIVPDLNLLIYAVDGGSPFHAAANRWWSDCLSGKKPVGLTHPVLFGFLRITTSSRVFGQPLSLDEAAGYLESWRSRAMVRVLTEDAEHSRSVLRLLHEAGSAGGNLVTDAQIAALALAHRGVVHTADRDFLRFPGVDCRFPLD